jgi:predicted alpha/beta superfamily hydrolase
MTEPNPEYPAVPIANSQLRHLQSSIVGQEYQIKIRLPEDYAETTTPYPVLYLLDGDYAFGMATDIVHYLIYGAHIPDLIIVSPAYGSKNPPEAGGTNMRSRDFAPFQTPYSDVTPGGEKYFEHFEQELIPFIEANYRVMPNDRTLWGYSFGGIFTTYALFRKPELFQRYIITDGIIEPTLALEESYAAQHSDLPIKLCISAPSKQDEINTAKLSAELFKKMASRNYASLQIEFAALNDIGHFAVGAEGLTKGLVAVFSE